MTIITIGIDVSKQNLDVFDSACQKHRRFPNTEQGVQQLIQVYLLSDHKKVILESTGIYQRLVHQRLEKAGFEVCLVNPYKTRCFAKAAGFLAKTDKVDAKMLCTYGQKVDCRQTPYPKAFQQELESLIHYKEVLQEERKRQINQKEYNHVSPLVQGLIKEKLKNLEEEIRKIQERIQALGEEDKDFKRTKDCLETVPGISINTIATLACYLPELGKANRKEIAALVGVAPMTVESGAMRGRAMIQGGRASVRKALYMPVLTCIRLNPPLRDFYQRLRQKGKPAKVALIAVMHKLILILNIMIKNNSPWREKNA